MWFIFALCSTLCWGVADLFYKKGSIISDKYSHLKTTIIVGICFGIHAICTLLFGNISFDPINIVLYLPVSFMYISSMAIGYWGLKYLMLSVSSPVQNTSGALVCLLCYFILHQTINTISLIAVILIAIGIFILGLFEYFDEKKEMTKSEIHKYGKGFLAFIIPIGYCILDALGTFFDAFYLDDVTTTPLKNVTEENIESVANTSYELTFFIVGLILFVYIFVIKKEKFFDKHQLFRLFAGCSETVGQLTYVYAMSGNGIVAAPMIASYSVVSVGLAGIFLKEKMKLSQYIAIGLVFAGIFLLGITEAL